MGPGHDINGIEQGVDIVLVLAEINSIFFLVAGILMWFFEFSVRRMLITHQCLTCC